MPVPIVPIVVGRVRVSAFLIKKYGKKKAIQQAQKTARSMAASKKSRIDPLTGLSKRAIKKQIKGGVRK